MEIAYDYTDVPTIREFGRCDKRLRALLGPFGSGKSSGCVVEIVRRAHAQAPGPDGIRHTRWAVVRNSYPQLKDTTIKTFFDWLPPTFFGQWRASDHTYRITEFPDCDIEVMFRALDRPDQIQNLLSLEITGAWINEAREVPWSIIEALDGRIGRFPAQRNGGCSWSGIFLDTNPPDSDSRFYRHFEEIKPSNAAIFRQPSGLSGEAENLAHLPKDYYRNLAVGKSDDYIQVYVHGDYGYVQDGKPVYSEYHDTTHCREIEVADVLPIRRSYDFGLTPACSFSQVLPDGRWHVIDELVSEDMGMDRFSDAVLEHCLRHYPSHHFEDFGDPAGAQRAQTDERSCYDILSAKGIDVMPGEQTLTIRLESVRRPLARLVDGRPAFALHPRCKTLRKGFQGRYRYRRLQVAADRYSDQPEKNIYSHVHDALQYDATRIFGAALVRSARPVRAPNPRRHTNWRAL
jgi:hypothetical protein